MDYKEAMTYLDRLQGHGMQFRLEAMNAMLAHRGNYHLDMKVVHIGGSNGKGSVTAMVSSALREQGYKVGTYTSPHLMAFEERIVVNGAPIPQAALAAIVTEVAPVIDRVKTEVGNVTYFEAVTLVALEHFRRERVDVVVLEVGLGGRLDATNVFPAPLASVITNVSLEHTNLLGDTVAKIATEKAEIIKPGRPIVTAATDEALDVILTKAEDVEAPTVLLHFDFHAVREGFTRDQQTLRVTGLRRDYGPLTLRMLGAHQVENAAVAVATLDTLDANGFKVSVEAVRAGLEKARWPGRLQWVPGKPAILLDGAHNAAGMEALVAYLQESDLTPVVLFGCLRDKDWLTMVNTLAPRVKAAVVTTPDFPG
ncbi:MAG TPA: folylpolyglutamate synthase/dihydrofolate synthase family protein, partial [Candidatus Thermoplasmatota archaeon]|nr:folylpolyglutamate synthase/dihydrofolate synthase family protein [Candidatus Thermoplasmatota archaeon]